MTFVRRIPMGTPPKEPAKYVPLSELYELIRSAYGPSLGKGESSRTVPLSSPYKPGTWFIDDRFDGLHGHLIEELVLVEPRKLTPTEFRWDEPEEELRYEGRLRDAERYMDWLRKGMVPLPVSVVEADNGELRVLDGHRRLYAHDRLGRKVPARISWSGPHPEHMADSRGEPMRTGLTYEMATGKRYARSNPMKGVPGGSVSACIARMSMSPDVRDPGALCASIARKRGEWIPRRKPTKMSAPTRSRSNPMAEHKYPGTQKSYYADLRRTAKEAIKEAKKATGSNDPDDWDNDLYEIVQQYADNEVIYTHRAREIITWTDHLDAYEEQIGDVEGGHTVTSVLTQIAYFAYMQDLLDAIGRVSEELAKNRGKREYYGSASNPAKKAAKKRAKKPAKKAAKRRAKKPAKKAAKRRAKKNPLSGLFR